MNGCLSCGAQNSESVNYCVRCGKRLEPPAPPPESWRYSDDLNRTQADQAGRQPAYQPPPAYQNYPPPAPQQVQLAYQPPPPHYSPYPAPVAVAAANANSQLPHIGMTMGIVVASIMVLGLIPCLGWLNWFVLILGKVTLILCIVALVTEKDPNRRSKAVVGLVVTSIALGIGIIRLIIGGGCL